MRSPDNFMSWFPDIFKVLGLWPPESSTKRLLYYTAYVPAFLFFTLHLNLSEIIECYRNRADFKQTLLNLAMIFLHLIATVRIVHWHFVRGDCKVLTEELLDDGFNFQSFHGCAFEKVRHLEAFRVGQIRFANRQSCSLYFGVASLIFCDILVSYVSVRILGRSTGGKLLPYNTYFFFDAERYYDAAWLYQFVSILYTMLQMSRK